ncbi:butyrophilin subfamily 3 member A2-like [Macrochelys suwanniensis]
MAAHSGVWILAGFFSVVLLAACEPVRIEADVGEDVLLPCFVKCRDAVSLSNPTVNWQWSGSSEVVNSYYHGKNHPEHQCGQYKGRTEFSSQGLSDGNASLLLKNVTPADFRNYTCHASLYENSPQTLQIVLLMQKKTQGANVPTDAYVRGEHKKLLRILSICVPLSALVILVVGSFIGYCWYKKKTMKSKEGDEEAA